MIIDVALGILLAFVILATAVIWIPAIVCLAGLALVALAGYGIWLYPAEVFVPVAYVTAFIAAAWLFQKVTQGSKQ